MFNRTRQQTLTPVSHQGFIYHSTLCGNDWSLLSSQFFNKKFVKLTFLLNDILTMLMSRNIFLVRVNFSLFHTVHIYYTDDCCYWCVCDLAPTCPSNKWNSFYDDWWEKYVLFLPFDHFRFPDYIFVIQFAWIGCL